MTTPTTTRRPPNALWLTLAIAASGCAPGDLDSGADSNEFADEADVEFEGVAQELASTNGIASINGLTNENGLRTTQGLKTLNGLSSSNGLTYVNGLALMNGLSTRQGLSTYNGLSVDCKGKTASQCTGEPDGLMSRVTGLMKDSGGVKTAEYMIRCVLPSTDAIVIKDYTGALVTLRGEIGVAPSWKTGLCDQACEQKVTACLLAFINQNGVHRTINMTASWAGNPFGTESSSYPIMESTFYGNIFASPVKAWAVSGAHHAATVRRYENRGTRAPYNLQLRSCSSQRGGYYSDFITYLGNCSAKVIGTSTTSALAWSAISSTPSMINKCSFATGSADLGGTPSACSGEGSTSRDYQYTVTTWRGSNPWEGGAASACHTVSPDNSSYCTSSCPCAINEGDCDSDGECQVGSKCMEEGAVDRCRLAAPKP